MRTKSLFLILTAVFFILAAVRTNSQPVVNQNDIKFESQATATLVGQDGLIMRTEDGGLNWNVLNSGITNVLNSNDAYKYTDELSIEHVVLYTVGENGVILSSIDNGQTWSLAVSGTTENLNKIITRSANEMYICGNNGTLLTSIDNGSTWQSATTNVTANLNSIALTDLDGTVNDVKAVTVGASGTILISRDYGLTWENSTSGVNSDLNAVVYAGNMTFVAVGNDGTVLKSVDGGITWSLSTSPTVLNLFDVKYLFDESRSIFLASGENGTILSSSDMGNTWIVVTTPTESDLFAINFGSMNYGISTGSSGTEIYTTDGGETWTESISPIMAGDRKSDIVKLSQNYPNPFNPSTLINYAISENSTVSIKIYDMTGREVRTLVNSYQAPGSYSVKFDAVNLSSGIYFYVLRANTGKNDITKTMRMILTK